MFTLQGLLACLHTLIWQPNFVIYIHYFEGTISHILGLRSDLADTSHWVVLSCNSWTLLSQTGVMDMIDIVVLLYGKTSLVQF